MTKNTKVLTMVILMSAMQLACSSSDDDLQSPTESPTQSPIEHPLAIVLGDDFSCRTSAGVMPDLATGWMEYPLRENEEADILAMEASTAFTSSDSLYHRTIEDLALIRAEFIDDPQVQMNASSCISLNSIMVSFDEQTMLSVIEGNYHDWQSLNEQYGVDDIHLIDGARLAVLRFKHRYFMATLRDIYLEQSLFGVEEISTNDMSGSPSQDICLENAANSVRYYIFKQGSGDCPAGCIAKSYSGYKVDAEQNIEAIGQYSTSSAATEPDWFTERKQCRIFL